MSKQKLNYLLFILVTASLSSGIIEEAHSQGNSSEKNVSVRTVRADDAFHVTVANDNPFSITLTLKVSGNNYKLNIRQPVTKVIDGNTTKHLLTVFVKDKNKGFDFNTNYSWVMGDVHARHDDSYIYDLPFESGKSFRIGQSYDGTFSHSGKIRYSVDFMMPLKTRVLAARSGRVVQLYENSDRGGESEEFKNTANYVVIEHNDGTFAEYAHLSRNGVFVSLGQKVYESQVIGLSGNTGYSSGPHLHFMVVKANKDGTTESVPVRFETKEGIIDMLEEGETYTAR